MHKENYWFATQTRTEIGVNKQPGSPRGWLLRALNSAGAETSEGIIQGRMITVAGVWFRPKTVPVLNYPSLIRFFEYDPNASGVRAPRRLPTHPAIGCAWCVPMWDIVPMITEIKATADLVWWARSPDPKSVAKPESAAMLSHEELYKLFEQGQRPYEISKRLNLIGPSVRYVYQKWEAGIPPDRQARKPIDHRAVLDDLRTNLWTQGDLAQKYGCSRFTINKIAKSLKNK